MRNQRGITILMAGVLAAGAVWFAAAMLNQGGEEALAIDSNAVTGVMPGINREQRLKEMQEELDQSMIAFSVNTNPVFADGSSKGNVMIENPQQNAKLLVAEIYLEDTGELVYRSEAIRPGSYIEEAKLDRELKQGDYPAVIYLKGYTEDSQEYIGQAGAQLNLHVQG